MIRSVFRVPRSASVSGIHARPTSSGALGFCVAQRAISEAEPQRGTRNAERATDAVP
jgi:hypothetical protein